MHDSLTSMWKYLNCIPPSFKHHICVGPKNPVANDFNNRCSYEEDSLIGCSVLLGFFFFSCKYAFANFVRIVRIRCVHKLLCNFKWEIWIKKSLSGTYWKYLSRCNIFDLILAIILCYNEIYTIVLYKQIKQK